MISMLNNLHFTRKSKAIETLLLEQKEYTLDFHVNEFFNQWQKLLEIKSSHQNISLYYQENSKRLMIKDKKKSTQVSIYPLIGSKVNLIHSHAQLLIRTSKVSKLIHLLDEDYTIQIGSDSLVGIIRSFTTNEDIKNPEQEALDLFVPGQNGSKNYRIPSMIKTSSGRLLSVIDRRLYHQMDWGDIDLSLRYSDDEGKTWSDDQVILDLAKDEKRSAFVIDASMVEDKVNRRIHLIVDMFPHSKGFFSVQEGEKPYPYQDGKLVLLDKNKARYLVDEQGRVYQENNSELTKYRVNMDKSDMQTWGDLYLKGKKNGNISLLNGDLHMIETAYIYHISSDDDGLTWSAPQDITEQIKADWMYFIGTGPGQGIQMHDGTLVFPIYHTNKNAGYSQSSAIIVSEDFGETWTRKTSPNQNRIWGNNQIDVKTMHNLNAILTEAQVVEINKVLYMFMRNYTGELCYVYSYDKGQTWSEVLGLSVYDPYCQLSAIADGTTVYISNPSQTGRRRGTLKTFVLADHHQFMKIDEQLINEAEFEYSCLAQINQQELGILYETKDKNGQMTIKFNKIKVH